MFQKKKQKYYQMALGNFILTLNQEPQNVKGSLICIALFYDLLISKELRYNTC